ncbi:MAG: cation:proton antiporter [Gemmatimonadota bacterium]
MVDNNVVLAVLSVMALLFIAGVLSLITARLRVPFAVTLVVVGLILGELLRHFPALTPLGALRLTPDLLIWIFLPTLIFQAAFELDARVLAQNLLPILVLAVPAIFVSFLIVGFGLHWTIGLPLGAALLFGALISSTDSSAVLAVFQEVGAPKRLVVLAQGENLFNDAASIVVFQIVVGALAVAGAQAAQSGAALVLGSAGAFFLNFFGGIAAGWAMGRVFTILTGIIEDDDLIEILLTTCAAYLSYLVAELAFQVSGAMATAVTGLVMASSGRTKYTPDTLRYLERFWEFLAYVANALTFLLIGLSVSLAALTGSILPIAAAIGVSLLARAVSIYGLFPLVNRMPAMERVDVRYQSTLVWGGLRGAMALVLALSIPETLAGRELLIAITFGTVLFSLLGQGLTLQPLIAGLGLQSATLPEQFVRDESMLTAKHRARQRLSELRRGGMFSDSVTEELERSYSAEEAAIREKIQALRERGHLGSREELKLLKREYLLVEKRVYQDLFHRGQLSEKVLRELHHSIELQIDHLRSGGATPAWTIHSPLRWKLEAAFFAALDRVFPWGNTVQHFRLNRIADLYEGHWGRLMASQRVLDELDTIEADGTNAPELVQELRDVYRLWNRNARARLDAVAEQFPEYVTKVQHLMAARLCLQAEEEVIEEMERLDVLPEREARQMRDVVRRKMKRLRKKPLHELRLRPEQLLVKVPLFRSLPQYEFERIVKLVRLRTFLADERVIRKGTEGDSMFLIGRGVVRVTVDAQGGDPIPIATLLAGEFFGEMALLSGERRNADVTTATHCTLYELTRADLESVTQDCPAIRNVLEATQRERSIKVVS